MVLSTDGPKCREALKACLHEEEWAASRGADDSRSRTAEHVNAQILGVPILEKELRKRIAHGVIEAQTTAVKENLVNIGGTDTAVDIANSLVAHNDAHAVDRSSIVVRLVALILKLALQLHAERKGNVLNTSLY